VNADRNVTSMNDGTIKVLLIDDDEDDFILTGELLSAVRAGDYLLDWASSYEEGLRVAGLKKHHVCLVDYQLGERNGIQLIREARKSRLTTPMILLTGQGDYDVDLEAMRAGATDFLLKDETSPARLERTIRYAVQLNIERAQLLSQLESEKTRLAEIFTHAPAFIASLRGPEHILELANAQFYDLIGNKRDIIGLTAREAFPEVESQGLFELLDDVYATGVPFIGDEMPVQFADGQGEPGGQRYINFVYQPVIDIDGAVSGIVCHGVNVTEQVLSRTRLLETENQLRQSQKLESIGMLAGGIAHDFNNLLTVITGYSELILRRLDKADVLTQNIGEIKKAAERATSLTRQLLAFSRKQVLQPKVLDLNTVILNIEKMLVRVVGEDLELLTLPSAGLGQVKADPGQIEQVIFNLVVNARDAMPQGGKITLQTSNIFLDKEYANLHVAVQPGWFVMLAVCDTGHGMDSETQKHIFEPFFTTKEPGKGTGLGLATVYGIIKQSGGNLWVYSEVGVGTTIKIYLPRVDDEAMAPEAQTSQPTSTAGTETILLAEDDEMVRQLARESLRMNGYTVLEAENGGEALSICQKHAGPIHLLLTDVVMPGMSGKTLAEETVKLRPDTCVLYMSGYTDKAIVHHGILDKDIAFLAKPFTPDALALKVFEVLHPN
jgi:signal transduction histidine kinase/DNA-binding response OmpR family regulator